MLHGAVCVLWDVWKVQSETLHGAVCVLQMSGRCNDRRCTVVFVCCGYVEGAMTHVAQWCGCVLGSQRELDYDEVYNQSGASNTTVYCGGIQTNLTGTEYRPASPFRPTSQVQSTCWPVHSDQPHRYRVPAAGQSIQTNLTGTEYLLASPFHQHQLVAQCLC